MRNEESITKQPALDGFYIVRAGRIPTAAMKAATNKADDSQPMHSFATLLKDLATLSCITVRTSIAGAKGPKPKTNL